eukprot:8598200-Pyramimonas_sp.AAC.1
MASCSDCALRCFWGTARARRRYGGGSRPAGSTCQILASRRPRPWQSAGAGRYVHNGARGLLKGHPTSAARFLAPGSTLPSGWRWRGRRRARLCRISLCARS